MSEAAFSAQRTGKVWCSWHSRHRYVLLLGPVASKQHSEFNDRLLWRPIEAGACRSYGPLAVDSKAQGIHRFASTFRRHQRVERAAHGFLQDCYLGHRYQQRWARCTTRIKGAGLAVFDHFIPLYIYPYCSVAKSRQHSADSHVISFVQGLYFFCLFINYVRLCANTILSPSIFVQSTRLAHEAQYRPSVHASVTCHPPPSINNLKPSNPIPHHAFPVLPHPSRILRLPTRPWSPVHPRVQIRPKR